MPPKAAHRAKTAARRAQVAELLLSGASNRKIAAALKCSPKTINADVNLLIAQWADDQKPEDRHRWRNLELAKLQDIELAVLRDAKKGNFGAVDRALRVMERRAKLLGLDATTTIKQDFVLEGPEIDAIIEREIKKLAEREKASAISGNG